MQSEFNGKGRPQARYRFFEETMKRCRPLGVKPSLFREVGYLLKYLISNKHNIHARFTKSDVRATEGCIDIHYSKLAPLKSFPLVEYTSRGGRSGQSFKFYTEFLADFLLLSLPSLEPGYLNPEIVLEIASNLRFPEDVFEMFLERHVGAESGGFTINKDSLMFYNIYKRPMLA